MHLLGFKCSLDGAADIVGSNSYLPVYCSVVESFFDRSVEGEDVFANCDYDLMKEYLEHFLLGWHRSPHNISGTFVCPVWMWKVFWKLLRGAVLLLYLAAGKRPLGRAERGPTKWPWWWFTFLVRWIAGPEAEESAFVKAQQLMTKLDPSADCQGCGGSRTAMLHCCVRCHRLLFVRCSGGGHNEVCELTCCNERMSTEYAKDYFLSTAQQSAKRLELVELGRQVLAEACRAVTSEAAKRGLKALAEYGEVMQSQVLPCSVKQLMQFAIWAVKKFRGSRRITARQWRPCPAGSAAGWSSASRRRCCCTW